MLKRLGGACVSAGVTGHWTGAIPDDIPIDAVFQGICAVRFLVQSLVGGDDNFETFGGMAWQAGQRYMISLLSVDVRRGIVPGWGGNHDL